MMNYSCEILKVIVFVIIALTVVSCSQEASMLSETLVVETNVDFTDINEVEEVANNITSEEDQFFGVSTKQNGKTIKVSPSNSIKSTNSSLNWIFLKMPNS